MSILDLSIFNTSNDFKTQALTETKASRVQPLNFNEQIWNLWSFLTEQQEDNIDQIAQYKNSVWVYACIDAIQTAYANLPINVFRIKSKGSNNRRGIQQLLHKYGSVAELQRKLLESGNRVLTKDFIGFDLKIEDIEEVTDDPFIDLIEQPNKHTIKEDYWAKVIQHLELTGDAFLEFVTLSNAPMSIKNPPIEMYTLNPNKVQIIPDKKEYIKGYIYESLGEMIPFNPDEIIHMKYVDPDNDYRGQGSIKALVDTLLMERYSIKYNKNFFFNNARPDGVLTTDKRLADDVFKRLKKQWQERYGGLKNAHKTSILEQGTKYQNIAINQKDSDFINSRKINREEILAVLKVPPVVVGLEVTNFATAKQQWVVFYVNNIAPKIDKRDNIMNMKIAPFFGNGELFIETDLSGIDVLKKDKSEEFVRRINNGMLTPNQALELENKPLSNDPGMDRYYLSPNLIPIGSSRDDDMVEVIEEPDENV